MVTGGFPQRVRSAVSDSLSWRHDFIFIGFRKWGLYLGRVCCVLMLISLYSKWCIPITMSTLLNSLVLYGFNVYYRSNIYNLDIVFVIYGVLETTAGIHHLLALSYTCCVTWKIHPHFQRVAQARSTHISHLLNISKWCRWYHGYPVGQYV